MLTTKEYTSAIRIRGTDPDNHLSLWYKHLDMDNLTDAQEQVIKQLAAMNNQTRFTYVIVNDQLVKARKTRFTIFKKTEKGFKKTGIKHIPADRR